VNSRPIILKPRDEQVLEHSSAVLVADFVYRKEKVFDQTTVRCKPERERI
jgi:hypothetical protein